MEDQIIALITAAGGRLVRQRLWEGLGGDQPSDEYWEVEQALVDAGRITRRRGRNGGIYLNPLRDDAGPSTAAPAEELGEPPVQIEQDRERVFYTPVLDTILDNWTEQPGFTHVFGAVTAQQGRRPTGGAWTRPDITICTVSDWIFSSRPEGDVRTIEVKRYDALNVIGVYEALSHKSRAHYSYLLIVGFPREMTDDQKSDFDNILSVAGSQGIGVITAIDAADWSTWSFELDPSRSDADSQTVNQFLLDQVSAETRDAFRQAIRSIKIEVNI